MPTAREAALQEIAVGDIFHACIQPDSGPSYICLALQIHEDRIFARRMTIQSVHWFDRVTGVEIGDNSVVIASIARLPDDIREIMLGLDQKYRRTSTDGPKTHIGSRLRVLRA